MNSFQGRNRRVTTERALDCGAGIGRVSKHLLLPVFRCVDLVELNKDFLDKAKTYLGARASKVGKYFCCGLQDLDLAGRKYDLIWIQWVTGWCGLCGRPILCHWDLLVHLYFVL